MDVSTTHIPGSISSDKYAYIVWVSMDAYVPTIWFHEMEQWFCTEHRK